MKLSLTLLLTLALISTPALAEDGDQWDWSVAPFLWAAGVSGEMTVGDIHQDIDVSFSELFKDLDIGGSIFAELGKGDHSAHFDYTYLRVKPEPTMLPSPPFPPGSELSSKLTMNMFESAYNYKLNETFSLSLGARLIDMKMRMVPDGAAATTAGPDWWDYFAGIKTHTQISANWDFSFYGTVGTGGSDLPWTLQGMFARRFSSGNRLGLGVRIWDIDYSENKDQYNALDLTIYGLMIGYEFN